MTRQIQRPPRPAVQPATSAPAASPTLEAPARPLSPHERMQATPEKKASLEYVTQALRSTQEGRDDVEANAALEDDDGVEAEGEDGSQEEEPPPLAQHEKKEVDQGFGIPEWFKMPSNGFPSDVMPGTTVFFVRFPVSVTGNAKRGERQCACRPLTVKAERFARSKPGSSSGFDLVEEYAKAMLCVIDGSQANFFARGDSSVNHFWSEIGPKARDMLIGIFNKSHRLSAEERTDFLANCVTARTVG